MRIAFVWTNGVRNKDRFDRWNDGLRAAMRIIEQSHHVTYHEPDEDLPEVDWILFWEAACTHNAQEWGDAYRKVMNSPQKKALLFAGGPIRYEWIKGFDHIFWESKVNGLEFKELGVSNSRAFGVNTDVFFPIPGAEKKYLTVTHGTCASWKRQWLVGDAIRNEALVFGQNQESDPRPFEECEKFGATVLPEQSYEETNRLINSAKVAVNCADMWGGGQRQTLEAMACGIPVVVMSDAPKNMEFIQRSGIGLICNPDTQSIWNAVNVAKGREFNQEKRTAMRQYVMDHWTPQHYADAILKKINV